MNVKNCLRQVGLGSPGLLAKQLEPERQTSTDVHLAT